MVWSDAVQFSDKNTAGRVFVREVQTQHFLEINAFGPHKADMLNQVVDILDDIHANTKFGNLRVEKLVPCPCEVCARQRSQREEAEFFNYDFLLKLLRNGETESDRCKISTQKFPIRDILKNAEVRVFKVNTSATSSPATRWRPRCGCCAGSLRRAARSSSRWAA